MDFATLKIFKAVADEGGITPAAKRLHRVQSNVTTRIQQLEESLGIELFIRKKGRLYLSPAGELFLGYAERILDISEQARNAVAGDVLGGTLRLGTLESTAASRLPPVLSRYHARHPWVRVELATGTTDALIEMVLGRGVEAAFVVDCGASAQLEAVPAFEEELVLVAPKSHPKVRRARDVRADTIISFPSGCVYRRRLEAWLAGAGIIPEKVLELGSYHAIIACVASGTGVALVPRSVLETVRGGADEVGVFSPGASLRRVTTSLVWRKGEASRALEALRDLIVEDRNARMDRMPDDDAQRRAYAMPLQRERSKRGSRVVSGRRPKALSSQPKAQRKEAKK